MKRSEGLSKKHWNRRSFIKHGMLAAGGATVAAGVLAHGSPLFAQDPSGRAKHGGLTPGDAALLRFAAAAEILESDFWGTVQRARGSPG